MIHWSINLFCPQPPPPLPSPSPPLHSPPRPLPEPALLAFWTHHDTIRWSHALSSHSSTTLAMRLAIQHEPCTMRLRNAASMLRARPRQPDIAHIAFTDHIVRHQQASMQHNLSVKPCGETSQFAEPRDTTSYRIVRTTTQLFTHPSHQPSTIAWRPSILVVPAASTQHVQACNPDTVRVAVGP